MNETTEKIILVTGIITFAIILVVGLSALFTVPVYFLWNWLMPMLFGFKTLTFWQAFGLLLLARFLFGSYNTKT